MLKPEPNNKKTEKEIFESLPRSERLSFSKIFLDLLNSDIAYRMGILPIVSAISVAMLAVFTLNPEIIVIDPIILKILVSILLLLIPLSLYIYLEDIEDGIKGTYENYKKWTGEDLNINDGTIKINWLDKFKGNFPYFVILIFFIIVTVLLIYIWKPMI